MLFIRGLHNIPKTISSTVVAIGDFDGVHLGHQAVIRRLIQEAKANQLTSILICFEPQPAEFFNKEKFSGRILRLRDKFKTLEMFDIDYLLCLPFNQTLADFSVETFVQNILIERLHCKCLVMGDDFRLGHKRQGCVNRLSDLGERYGFTVIAENAFHVLGCRNSSTRIRQALRDGDFNLAKKLMGHPYILSGKVRCGHGRGKQLGFPTANIPLFHYKMATSGIFIVEVIYERHWKKYGLANLGIRPTFNEHQFVLEVYILSFDGDLYGKTLSVKFLHKLRNEKHFKSVESLITQIEKDVIQARKWLQSVKR